MVRLISRQRGGLAALKLTKLFGIYDFPAAKDSGKVLIIIIYCYLIIITIIITIIIIFFLPFTCIEDLPNPTTNQVSQVQSKGRN